MKTNMLNFVTKFFLAMVLAIVANQFICSLSAHAQAATAPPIFYVSPNGLPTNGGTSWEDAFGPDLDGINWNIIQTALNNNVNGTPWTGHVPLVGALVQVALMIDGGPPGGYVVYYKSLHPIVQSWNDPLTHYPVIAAANDPPNYAAHGGQVIINGSRDTTGAAGVDFGDCVSMYLWGNGECSCRFA
jgi:hypothetical protein